MPILRSGSLTMDKQLALADISILQQALQSKDFMSASEAANSLIEIEDASEVHALSLTLLNKNLAWTIRHNAAVALGEMLNRDALPALLATLYDTESLVREAVIHSLSKIDADAAIPLLSTILLDKREDRSIRIAAVDALGSTTKATALPILIQALQEEDEKIRRNAAYAIGDIAGSPYTPAEAQEENTLPALWHALQDEDTEVRTAAAYALEMLWWASRADEIIEDISHECFSDECKETSL